LLAALSLAAAPQGDAHAADGAAPLKPADPEYRAAIKEGDKLFLARQFDQAQSAYQRAVKRQSLNPEAYGRLAAAQRELGKFDEAFATLAQGLETSTTVTERAKLLLLQADLRERQRALPQASERWNEYLDVASGGERTIDLDADEEEVPVAATPGAVVYPATAHERLKQIAAAEKRFKEYAVVKDRIQRREAKADEQVRKAK
jgi:tetratricopeptide (TPR) repeat protein